MSRDRLLRHAVVASLILCAGFGATVGIQTLSRHHAVASAGHGGAPTTPTACRDESAPGGDACAGALGDARFSTVLGLPVAAWAAGAHALIVLLTWLLAISLVGRRTALAGASLAALGVMALVVLGGTVAYLYIGLGVLAVRCPLCLTMHGLGIGVALVAFVALLRWRRPLASALRRPRGWLVVAATLALWPGLAWAGSAWTEARSAPSPATTTASPAGAGYSETFARACAPDACPEALLFKAGELPTENQSLVLADPPGAPVLVELIDTECPACRALHQVMGPLYRDLLREGQAGLRLVLWPRDARCNPHAGGGGHGGCSANAALVCAHRHGGPVVALDYLDWEMAAAPGYHTATARRRWLTLNVDNLARRCFDAELSLRDRGTLALHADWGAQIRKRSGADAGCGATGGGWWCFDQTPSFGVFRASMPPKLDRDVDVSGAPAKLRRSMLERCLER